MKRKVNGLLIVGVGIALLIVINNTFFPIYSLSGFIQKTLVFPKTFLYRVKTRVSNTILAQQREDWKRIEENNRKILRKLKDYEIVKSENEALRNQFTHTKIKPLSLIPSRVIGFLGSYTRPHVLIIDKGEEDGVKKGAAVVWEDNLVGKVEHLSKSYSRVMLPHDSRFSLVGKTMEGNAVGILKGANDFILFDKVSIADSLETSDVVLTHGEVETSGNGNSIYPNLIVGRIVSINKAENKPFQNAKIESIINYSRLEVVFVVSL